MAIEQVWVQCLALKRGNFHEALKHYKGTVNNYTSYNRTLTIYKRLKDIDVTTNNNN